MGNVLYYNFSVHDLPQMKSSGNNSAVKFRVDEPKVSQSSWKPLLVNIDHSSLHNLMVSNAINDQIFQFDP